MNDKKCCGDVRQSDKQSHAPLPNGSQIDIKKCLIYPPRTNKQAWQTGLPLNGNFYCQNTGEYGLS